MRYPCCVSQIREVRSAAKERQVHTSGPFRDSKNRDYYTGTAGALLARIVGILGARSSRPLSIYLSVLAIASYQEMISGAGAQGTSGRRCRDEAQVTHGKVRSIGRIRYRRRRSCLLTIVVRSSRRYAGPTPQAEGTLKGWRGGTAASGY